MTITRIAQNRWSVVTDTVMSDGSLRADDSMALVDGNRLRSVEGGGIRIGGLLVVQLNVQVLDALLALQLGDTYVSSRAVLVKAQQQEAGR